VRNKGTFEAIVEHNPGLVIVETADKKKCFGESRGNCWYSKKGTKGGEGTGGQKYLLNQVIQQYLLEPQEWAGNTVFQRGETQDRVLVGSCKFATGTATVGR